MTPSRAWERPFSVRFLWYLGSWSFWIWFLGVKLLLHWLEAHPVMRRAELGGFDVAMAATEQRDAQHTAVVAITSEDVATVFAGRRPIPAESLLKVVRLLQALDPAVLVVDVFTDGAAWSRAPLGTIPRNIVWAQGVDTSTGAVMPVLGGQHPEAASGLAAMLAEDDGLVRRVRLRFVLDDAAVGSTVTTLSAAAVEACPAAHDWCRLAHHVPADTASIALRNYRREPALYTLSDALAAARRGSGTATFAERIVVLGFADGSDQLATSTGIHPGPQVVADAIESLIDGRGGIRRLPAALSWAIDIFAAILVAAVQFSLHTRPQAAALWTLLTTIAVYFASRLLLVWPGYWVAVVPVMVGMWVEQLLEEVRGKPHPTGPPAWMVATQRVFARKPPEDDAPDLRISSPGG